MKTQRGFSLVELMIAMTIGMVLLLGLAGLFQSMGKTYKAQQAMLALQYGERMAMFYLSTALHNAGSYPPTNGVSATINTATGQFPVAAPFTTLGQSLGGTGAGGVTPNPAYTVTGIGSCPGLGTNTFRTCGGLGTDTLSVRFVAGTSASADLGCTGTPLLTNELYQDDFQVTTTTFNGVTIGVLRCTESDNGPNGASVTSIDLISGATATGVTSTGAQVLTGLVGMNVLYGLDTTNSGSVNQYMTATAINNGVIAGTAGVSWLRVNTAYVTLQFANPLSASGLLSSNGTNCAGVPICVTQAIPYSAGLYTRTIQ